MYMWNIAAEPHFFNNQMTGNSGGLVRPNASGQPMIADLWAPSSIASSNDLATPNEWDNPCWSGGKVNLQAETLEFAAWQQRVLTAEVLIGNQDQ